MRLSVFSLLLIFSLTSCGQKFYLFTGTYTGSGSKGIYVYQFDAANGTASLLSSTDSVASPSYLTVSDNGKYVYAVNETHPGYVSSFSFDKKNAKLSFINSQPTGGYDPCYVANDKSGRWLMVANYTGGSAAVFPVSKEGRLAPYSQLIQDSGSSVNKERQEKAHVHSTIFSPDQQFLFTPDLGMDKVMIYKFEPSLKQPLVPASPAYEMTMEGDGPRHLAFHPNKKYVYLISELSGAVSAYKYDDGKLKKFQHINAHPEDFKGTIGSADIHVSPDGMFLYVSNRGDENTITIFSIDQQTGSLKLKGYQSTMGKTPRNFIIDPTGNYLLVANQGSDNIVIFKRDKATGMLSETGNVIKVPKPVCLQMLQIK